MTISNANHRPSNDLYENQNLYNSIKPEQPNNVDISERQLIIEQLKELINNLHEKHKENSRRFENNGSNLLPTWGMSKVGEEIWNAIAEKIYQADEKILSDFFDAVNLESSDGILNQNNVSVFFELATHFDIPWLINDCKDFLLKPIEDVPLAQYINWKEENYKK
jgi:hypothetical protein